jgi:DNA-binding Lrp family transcriptional regulator
VEIIAIPFIASTFIYIMPEAFVLLNCDLGGEEEITKELLAMRGVASAYRTHGVYDMIIKLDLDSSDELRRTIGKIRRIDKVRSSLTLIVAEKPS